MASDLVQRLREEFLVDPSCSSGEAADRIERLEADLDDYRTIVREVAKVYDNLTSGAASYPDTLASAVIAEHDERCYFRSERDEARAEVERLRGQGIPAKVCGASFVPIDASHPIEWLRGRKIVELAFEDPPVPTRIGADWLVVLADTEEADDADE